MQRSYASGLVLLMLSSAPAHALIAPVGRADIERALALTRWPSTDADRSSFHNRYIVRYRTAVTDAVAIESVEVVTEFRRMELIGEEHARLNDLFARGGAIREAEEALHPFRGRVSIVAHVRLGAIPAGIPEFAILFDDAAGPRPIAERSTPLYSESSLIGVDAESAFDAASIPQTSRTVVVLVDRRPLARATFDFRALD